MLLSQLGEFGLIDLIRKRFSDISTGRMQGIGDDCAVIPCDGKHSLVVTADMSVEDIHFLRDAASPYLLGRKTLATNLSDVASMGAAPVATFLSIALPRDISAPWAEAFVEGYHSLSAEFGVPLLGGDTTSSPDKIVVSITAVGRAADDTIKYRHTARPGDRIFVTGTLGDSARGLLDIRQGRTDSEFAAIHHDPVPRVREGRWLGLRPEVHAMMDLSDGLASDLVHILEASDVAAEIELENIPTRTSVELAVTGGEDYELLLTAEGDAADGLVRAYGEQFGILLREIGRIASGSPAIHWKRQGQEIAPDWHGFRHF